ncbi:hypothetical protein SLA2020_366410 [Shorea laevis]
MARIKPQALLQQSKKKKGPNRISVTTIILCNLIVVLIVFFVLATYRHWSQRSRLQTDSRQSVSEDEDAFVDPKKSDVPGYAIFSTPKGDITVELYKESSPEVVDESLTFGDNQKVGATKDWTLRGKHYNHLETSMKHEAFMLGTSKGKRDDKGFDLFITTAPIPDLNEKLIVFGRVLKGEEVVQEIEEVDTDENYQPKSHIGIIKVSLKQKI